MLGSRIIVDTAAEVYKKLGKELLVAPTSSPRGIETKEIIAPQIIIKTPRYRLVYNQARKFNIFHALTEAIMLHSPSDKVKHISEFNKNMAKFSDDGITMYGSYGKKISDFIPSIVRLLRRDPDSRQAVLSIFRTVDTLSQTKDVPCTETLQFLIRDGKLIMITNMRSNDILYGFQYDVFMFTMLQQAVANSLGIPMGIYVHQPASLHVYKDTFSFNGYDMLHQMAFGGTTDIGFDNTGDIEDWNQLAKVYTGESMVLPVERTTNDVMFLINCERQYRMRKNDNDRGSWFKHCYKQSPEWAKPFIQKWIK